MKEVWRRLFGIPWVTTGLALAIATVQSPPTWFGSATVASTLGVGLALALIALLPAVGFLLIRRRGGLLAIASLGLVTAFALFLAMAGIHPSGLLTTPISIALVADVVVCFVAIVVLLVVSHEPPPPSASPPWPDIPSFPDVP